MAELPRSEHVSPNSEYQSSLLVKRSSLSRGVRSVAALSPETLRRIEGVDANISYENEEARISATGVAIAMNQAQRNSRLLPHGLEKL